MGLSNNDFAPPLKRRSVSKKAPPKAADVQNELTRRVPPNSQEAEQAVIAGIFLCPEMMNTIADILVPEDFYYLPNQLIYKAFLELYSNAAPIDYPSVATMLNDRNEIEAIGGSSYLVQISQAVVTGANAEYYAEVVRNKAMQRNLITACAGIISNSFESGREVNELLDESEQAVFAVSRRTAKQEFSEIKDVATKVMNDLSKMAASNDNITGVATGYKSLDYLTAGLQKSDLIIVAARPSMGKTAFALCIALNAALQQDASVGIFSLEMPKEQLMQRFLAIQGRVDLSKLRRPGTLTDDEWDNLRNAADVISKLKLYIDDSSGLTPMELRSRARRLKAEHDLNLVVIDYLQLMRSSRRVESRELEISDISRSLKALAKELEIPVVALSQLNRKVEDRTDKRPILADLRESGAIEQDADVIMFVYRDDVYKIKKPSERPEVGEAEIIIGKQRNGPVGTADLMYVSKYTSFESRAPDYMSLPSEDAIQQ